MADESKSQSSQLLDTVDFVRFEVADIHGIARSKTVPKKHFETFAKKGLNFILCHLSFDTQGGLASGTGFAESSGYADGEIYPDMNTLSKVPWADSTARVICQPCEIGTKNFVAASPRVAATKQLEALAELGYQLYSGHECEVYIMDASTREGVFPGINIFTTLRNNCVSALTNAVMRDMDAMGVDIITCNAEYGPGQFEIVWAPAMGIKAADDCFTFKNGIKELCAQRGYMASFMSKPHAGQSGCSMHYNQSLWTLDGQPAMADASAVDGLSDAGRWFLAGQLAHAPALAALMAPTVNCNKRLVDGSFAPSRVSWGRENRTAMVRVKSYPTEQEEGAEAVDDAAAASRAKGTYFENRLGSGGANPYLVTAGCAAAGADGIRRQLEPPTAMLGASESAYDMGEVLQQLPRTLSAALDALEADDVMVEALGPSFVQCFVAMKRHEIALAEAAGIDFGADDFAATVTQWERDMYQEFL